MRIIHPNTDLSKPIKQKKQPKPLRKRGKHSLKWEAARAKWFKANEAPYYICYLCGKSLLKIDVTLDHVIPRSRAPKLRYEQSNLKPCCYPCNVDKGSKVY